MNEENKTEWIKTYLLTEEEMIELINKIITLSQIICIPPGEAILKYLHNREDIIETTLKELNDEQTKD